LVADVQRGDPRALTEFAARLDFVARVVCVLNRKRGAPLSDHELEDVVQDVVTVVWSKLGEYSGLAALETWVYPFCVHVFQNAARKHGVRRRLAVDPAVIDERSAPGARDRLESEGLVAALADLDPGIAEVIRLHVVDELSFPQIADLVGRPTTTLKSWYYKGLTSLSRALAGESR
jgi:RNA polymerase sigma factor (sigma-70 family)